MAEKLTHPKPDVTRSTTLRTCQDCGYITDAATEHRLAEIQPKKGDYSVCFNCGHLMIFTGDGLNVRPPTEVEIIEVANDSEVATTIINIIARGQLVD